MKSATDPMVRIELGWGGEKIWMNHCDHRHQLPKFVPHGLPTCLYSIVYQLMTHKLQHVWPQSSYFATFTSMLGGKFPWTC